MVDSRGIVLVQTASEPPGTPPVLPPAYAILPGMHRQSSRNLDQDDCSGWRNDPGTMR
jgi:hypothetical protein